MATAAELLGGATLGVFFQQFYDKIESIIVQYATIRKRVDSLARILRKLSIRYKDFHECYPACNLKPETLGLQELFEKAEALVKDCARLRWWKLRLIRKCSKRLDTLNDSLEDFLKIDLPMFQYSHVLVIQDLLRKNRKLDHMYVKKAAPFTPPYDQSYGGADNGKTAFLGNHDERPGLRSEFYYERRKKHRVKLSFCFSYCYDNGHDD